MNTEQTEIFVTDHASVGGTCEGARLWLNKLAAEMDRMAACGGAKAMAAECLQFSERIRQAKERLRKSKAWVAQPADNAPKPPAPPPEAAQAGQPPDPAPAQACKGKGVAGVARRGQRVYEGP